jgi:hypothetical protein
MNADQLLHFLLGMLSMLSVVLAGCAAGLCTVVLIWLSVSDPKARQG